MYKKINAMVQCMLAASVWPQHLPMRVGRRCCYNVASWLEAHWLHMEAPRILLRHHFHCITRNAALALPYYRTHATASDSWQTR